MSNWTPPRASRTISSGMPFSTSLATTSERFTALIAAPGIAFSTTSLPGSSLRSANTAEASRTMLLIPARLAAFPDQILGQPKPFRDIRPHQSLRPPDSLMGSQNTKTLIFQHQHELIPRVD